MFSTNWKIYTLYSRPAVGDKSLPHKHPTVMITLLISNHIFKYINDMLLIWFSSWYICIVWHVEHTHNEILPSDDNLPKLEIPNENNGTIQVWSDLEFSELPGIVVMRISACGQAIAESRLMASVSLKSV